MKKCRRKPNANSSGQLLIIAALAIAILISSTTIYVYELSKEKSSTDTPPVNNVILALKQSTRNTMISSLANVSNGGENETLTRNLSELSSILANQSYFGICNLMFTPLNSSPYQSGTRVSWGSNGVGVSSMYANFSLDFSGIRADVQLEYDVNITTALNVESVYSSLGAEKRVNVTCRVFNEGEAALAKNITLFYEEAEEWVPVNYSHGLSVTDYGNGTYLMSFAAQIPGDTVRVLVQAHDLRDIFVRADATCDEI